ncbi:MAG TPA: 7-cyano-7-deazaguanine synthase [Vicinamibacterales bacterium]|nr:7-cyano-7-deazaguanine synthase [Vicinamibacterales bacterium]
MESVVLLSGGLDSAVLLAHEAQRAQVHPVYVRVGLAWEDAELTMLRELLTAPVFNDRVEPLTSLDFTMRDVLAPSHWAIRGTPPAYHTPDEDVYLPGRNVVLITKAAVLAVSRGCRRLALGTLANNPFPDATPHFFEAMSRALSLGLGQLVEIAAPLARMRKEDVIRLGEAFDVPLERTLSCMNPLDEPRPVHCGLCSKCRERRNAFTAAGVGDRTSYANPVPR